MDYRSSSGEQQNNACSNRQPPAQLCLWHLKYMQVNSFSNSTGEEHKSQAQQNLMTF